MKTKIAILMATIAMIVHAQVFTLSQPVFQKNCHLVSTNNGVMVASSSVTNIIGTNSYVSLLVKAGDGSTNYIVNVALAPNVVSYRRLIIPTPYCLAIDSALATNGNPTVPMQSFLTDWSTTHTNLCQ